MSIGAIILFICYALPLIFIAGYSIAQLHLLKVYLGVKNITASISEEAFLPKVTVQLPIFNELYVVERLIERIAELDYPSHLLEIQVLDDSTDETKQIVANAVRLQKEKGINIKHIWRQNRQGYKAGALEEATRFAEGEFIAIFDADFYPRKDFLKVTIPHFQNDKVGVVQTRWDHLNLNYSILTKVQGFALDAHFTIEQTGRNKSNHFINFNGTAGVWRKACINDAGGWHPDTLTEDLDLSYRAQLKRWEFVYLEDIESPAELPVTMTAIKSQQFRWTKGAAEVAKKMLPSVLKSDVSKGTKYHAIFHLLNSSVYIPILIVALLSVPVLIVKNQIPEMNKAFKIAGLFILSLAILGVSYYVSLSKVEGHFGKRLLKFLYLFPSFLAFSMGLSLHNALAVIEGYRGKKSPFIRTPKFNINSNSDSWKGNKYSMKKMSPLLIVEALLCLYFGFGIYKAFELMDFGLIHFHILLFLGFGSVVYFTIKHAKNA